MSRKPEAAIGYVEDENRDKTALNPQKEKYIRFGKYYRNRLINISNTLRSLDYLTSQKQDYSNLDSIAPGFSKALIWNFWAQAIIELHGFYYQNNEYSFSNFFNYIRANWNLIFTGDFYETINIGDSKQVQHIKFTWEDVNEKLSDCEKLIQDQSQKIEILSALRDNVFAHFGEWPDGKKISVDELLDILRITEQIINRIDILYNRTITCYGSALLSDVSQLCYSLNMYIKYRIQIRDFEHKEKAKERNV